MLRGVCDVNTRISSRNTLKSGGLNLFKCTQQVGAYRPDSLGPVMVVGVMFKSLLKRGRNGKIGKIQYYLGGVFVLNMPV